MSNNIQTPPRFALVETFGHQRFGARVTEVEQYGARFLRCEVFGCAQPTSVDLSPGAIFRLTDVGEARARAVIPTHDAVPREALRCEVEGCGSLVDSIHDQLCDEHDRERERMKVETALASECECVSNGCDTIVPAGQALCRECEEGVPF